MRLLRAVPIGLSLALAISLLPNGGWPAGAQEVDRAEQEAAEAGARADAASGLVDEALANRAEIELELASTIARVNDLSAQLSSVAARLDRLQEQIGFADAELTSLQSAIELQAIDAYMTALTFPSMSFVSSETMEQALVAGTVAEEVVGAGKEQVGQLVIKKRDLEDLQVEYLSRQQEVASLEAEVEAEMAKLEGLYEEADAEVAEAIRQANAADVQYRAALSAVESARAREAERVRQEQRPDPDQAPAPDPTTASPTTPPSTSPPASSPPSTSGGGGGEWTGRPEVEQWRSLVSQYFPADRVDEALQIIQCESIGDPNAYNPYSGASGLFQFLPSTWASTAPKAGFGGYSVFDPTANVATAAWLANRYEELGQYYWRPWNCRRVLN